MPLPACFRRMPGWGWIAFVLLGVAFPLRGAIVVGPAPAFAYIYDPQGRLALDTNALNEGVRFHREPPSFMNCCFISPQSQPSYPYVGRVSYAFVAAAGYRIQHVIALQKASLFASGTVFGEAAADNGQNRIFFDTVFRGSEFSTEQLANIRHADATNVTLRYTLVVSNAFNYNIQLGRDCDDAPGSLAFNGTVLTEADQLRKVVLIRPGSTWKYRDNGVSPPASWVENDFDDSGWLSGPAELGYGDGDEATVVGFGPSASNKHITTWFRKSFSLPGGLQFERAYLGMLRDDGSVVYLNGQEVFRSNMPAGPINATTRPLSGITGLAEARYVEAIVDPARFIEGTNVVAVEIRQNIPESSDISFDLDLWGFVVSPQLVGVFDDDCLFLLWEGGPHDVQEAPTPEGPWSDRASDVSSPYGICDPGGAAFFRLKRRF